jgi:hypothetical protein
MTNKDSAQPAIPSGKSYFVAWIVAQVMLNLPWLAPWVTNQIKAAQSVDATLTAPDASKVLYAGIAMVVSALIGFAHKVWKELEADAVKGSANVIKAFPGMAKELVGRCWDACWGFCTRWFLLWSFKRRYLKELCFRYGLFNDKGLGLINANRLDLDKVYVELQAAPGVNLNKPNFNPVTREICQRAPLWEHLRTLRPGFALSMIGAPGSGKTTLLHHAMLTAARNRLWRRRMRFRLPIFIELRKIAAELPEDAGKTTTLPKLIESLWKKDTRFTELLKHLPKTWLNRWLLSGHCLLLWDGLDEVADPVQRKRVRDWLENAVLGSTDYRNNLSIVTARPAGYRDSPLDHAQAVEIQAFQWADTKRFVQQWYHATEVVSSGNADNAEVRRRATDESNELLTRLQDSPKLGDLAVNPLLLTMICMVHRFHGALPGNRSQLYDDICQVLLERWRQQRGMKDHHTGQQKLEVLRPLALWMMEHRVKEINEDEMLPLIVEPLARIGVAPGAETAIGFIQELRDSSGLWLDKELKTWAFAHLTFQEHLCADAWVKKPALCPTSGWQPYLRDPWWRETLLLYVAKTEDATQLALDALEGNSNCRAFALQMMDEKINLTASVRARMEQTLLAALETKDQGVFLEAAEAWIARQQERNYQRLDDQRQISGWVTAAEYQAFIFAGLEEERPWRTPLHWYKDWFSSDYQAPILGISARQADKFCEWLNQINPAWVHRLPTTAEVQSVMIPTQGFVAWLKDEEGGHHLQYGDKKWPLLLNKRIATATNTTRTRPLTLASALIRGIDNELTFTLTLTRTLTLTFYQALKNFRSRDRAASLPRDHAQDRALSLARAFDCALELPLLSRNISNFHVELVSSLDRTLESALDRDFDRAFIFARILVRAQDLSHAQYLAHALDNSLIRAVEQAFARVLDLAHDLARDLARTLAHDLDLDLDFEFAPSGVHPSDRVSKDIFLQKLSPFDGAGNALQQRSACLLRSLQPAITSSSLPQIIRTCSRAIALIYFDILRDAGIRPSPEIRNLESVLLDHVDRTLGRVEAFEGLRVVRERRQ